MAMCDAGAGHLHIRDIGKDFIPLKPLPIGIRACQPALGSNTVGDEVCNAIARAGPISGEASRCRAAWHRPAVRSGVRESAGASHEDLLPAWDIDIL